MPNVRCFSIEEQVTAVEAEDSGRVLSLPKPFEQMRELQLIVKKRS